MKRKYNFSISLPILNKVLFALCFLSFAFTYGCSSTKQAKCDAYGNIGNLDSVNEKKV
tara:strand:+ start:817 stop:990 length:174 start_codon:yes stop_codon:yes gene_type:complete